MAILANGCAATSQLNNLNQGYKIDSASGKSLVFGKIIYQSNDFFLKRTPYVKLHLKDKLDKEYVFTVGYQQSIFAAPWNLKSFKSDYFFMELMPGDYKIFSISFPYGQDKSTIITEDISISFSVKQSSVIYLGILKFIIIGDKIKVGGLPLLKPGVNYKLEILNEQQEAVQELKLRYPLVDKEAETILMKAE
jgi:hypothetical protein